MQFNQYLDQVKVYEAGKPIESIVRDYGIQPHEVIKLASNENPHGCSPRVNEAIQAVCSQQMPVYPDDSYHDLKEALGQYFNLSSNQVIIGCGSDQVISFCVQSKSELKGKHSKMLISGLTFPMYQISAHMHGVQIFKTPSQQHDIQEFQELYQQHQHDIVFLCVPNNPLGECLDQQEVEDLVASFSEDTLVVVDGAYQEYAKYRSLDKWIQPKLLLDRFENVVYLGTFSKAYGLGGMRIGYGLANPSVIKILHKLRPPFNITSLSLQAAKIALQDQEFVQNSLVSNFQQMKRYESFFKDKKIEWIESYTNFLMANLSQHIDSTALTQTLFYQGIIVRNFADQQAVRITIGRKEQNDVVLQALQEILSKKSFSKL